MCFLLDSFKFHWASETFPRMAYKVTIYSQRWIEFLQSKHHGHLNSSTNKNIGVCLPQNIYGQIHNHLDMPILCKVEQVKYLYNIKLKINQRGVPGCSVVESCLPMQESGVQCLTWQGPTCHGELGPCTQPLSLCPGAWKPQLLNPWAATAEACAP